MIHDGAEHSGDTRPPTDSGFTFQLGGRELLVSALSDDIRHVVLSNGLNQILLSSMGQDGAEHSGDIRLPTDGGLTLQLGGQEFINSALFDDIRHVVLSGGFNQIVPSRRYTTGLSHNVKRTRLLGAGVGGASNSEPSGWVSICARWQKLTGTAHSCLAPPPDEPQTAGADSPTASGYRTMSSAHACWVLASEEHQTASPQAGCQFVPGGKN